MKYNTRETIEALGEIDPEFQQYLEAARAATSAAGATGTTAAPSPTPQLDDRAPGETLDIPMRDGYMSQLRIHRPKDSLSKEPGLLVVLIYGGGFQTGDNSQQTPFALAMNDAYGITVINLSYRLAPQFKFPTAPNDVWDSLKWIVANQKLLHVDLEAGFIVGGASAGANLSAVAAQRWHSEKISPPITGTLLMIPWLLLQPIVPEKYKEYWLANEQNAQAPLFNSSRLVSVMQDYAPDPTSELFSPFNAQDPHVNLPPTYISACGMDPLRDDALIYYRALLEHGVKTKLDIYPGVPHGHVLIPSLKSAQKCARDFVQAVGWVLGKEESNEKIESALSGFKV